MLTWRTAVRDARSLLAFRSAQLRGRSRSRARIALVGVGVVTLAVAWLPQYLPQGHPNRVQALVFMPTAYLAFLLLTALAATVAGGGRELIPRDQATAYPISAKTDVVIGLTLAPLNIAWLLEAWTLLTAISYGLHGGWGLVVAQVVTVAWIATATVAGQMVAWAVESIRRLRHGIAAVRGLAGALGAVAAWLVVDHRLGPLLDKGFLTKSIVNAQIQLGADHHWSGVLVALGGLIAVSVVCLILGARFAELGSRRQPVEEARLESGQRSPRSHPASDFMAMLRIDRASVWRAVPLRRGIVFLGVLPGLVALAGGLHWQVITMFPGLVCSGGALLFGVNVWCLDGRGALWRESLPGSPLTVFAVRSVVLGELLLVSMVPAVALGALRAGMPPAADLAAVVCGSVATIAFVVGRCLRWSITKPYPADLRSARATPAPPLAMVGYSARLALATTLLGLLFYATSTTSWNWSVVVALPIVLFALSDLVHTARMWESGETRSGVLATVAA